MLYYSIPVSDKEGRAIRALFARCGVSSKSDGFRRAVTYLAMAELPYYTCSFCKEITRRRNDGKLPFGWMAPTLGLYACERCAQANPPPPLTAGLAVRTKRKEPIPHASMEREEPAP